MTSQATPVPQAKASYIVRRNDAGEIGTGWTGVLALAILVFGILLPVEVRLNVSGQVLYGYRIAWLVLSPLVLISIVKGRITINFVDILVFLGCGWTVLAFVMNYGPGRGIPSGMALALDLIMPYLIVRTSVRTLNDLRRVLVLLAPVFFLFAILMPVEGTIKVPIIRKLAEGVFGGLTAADYGELTPDSGGDSRYGFLRAMGPFSHPIMAGLFFASLMPLYFFSGIRGWPRLLGLLSGLAAVFSFSSGALLGILLFVGFAAYDKLQRSVAFLSWSLLAYVTVALAAALQVLADKGVISVVVRFTMNPASGFYRMNQWEYGLISVQENPWFGIGFEPYKTLAWMGRSIDTYWLFVAVRDGAPTAIFLLLATIFALVYSFAASKECRGADQATLMGISIALLIFFVLGFTVSYIGSMLPYFAIILGLAASSKTLALASKGNELRPMASSSIAAPLAVSPGLGFAPRNVSRLHRRAAR